MARPRRAPYARLGKLIVLVMGSLPGNWQDLDRLQVLVGSYHFVGIAQNDDWMF